MTALRLALWGVAGLALLAVLGVAVWLSSRGRWQPQAERPWYHDYEMLS